jgi:hypothetical protein
MVRVPSPVRIKAPVYGCLAAICAYECLRAFRKEKLNPSGRYEMLLAYVHASFMVAGFIFIAAGFITARFLKRKIWWLKLHRILGISGTCCVLSGVCFEFIHLSLISAGHFNVAHAYLGMLIVLLSLITPATGLIQIKMPGEASKIRPLHRWSGRAIMILMGINIVSGLYTAGII